MSFEVISDTKLFPCAGTPSPPIYLSPSQLLLPSFARKSSIEHGIYPSVGMCRLRYLFLFFHIVFFSFIFTGLNCYIKNYSSLNRVNMPVGIWSYVKFYLVLFLPCVLYYPIMVFCKHIVLLLM